MIDQSRAPKRKRGVVLSTQGWQRLQSAEHLAAIRDNGGKPYTLEQLSTRTGLSNNTLTKVRRRQKPVDQPTLDVYFQAFGLSLTAEDYLNQDFEPVASPLATLQQTPLKGQLEVDSPFYIYRPPAERLCTEEITKPGALLRIKAPRQFGKTSLIDRILSYAHDRQFRTAVISLQAADRQIFSDLERFLQWLCVRVARSLELPPELDSRWDSLFGGSYSCSDYFETYLLPAQVSPLLLVLDEVNEVFNYPDIAADFFAMIRSWYEQGRHAIGGQQIWQQLRLVIVYSTDIYLPLNLNQSPFNVGLLVDLPMFTPDQVKELAQRYGLPVTAAYLDRLYQLVGGHPYLVQLALFHLAQQQISLEELISTAIDPDGVFSSHLRQQFGYLEEHPDLLDSMQQVVQQPEGAELHPQQAFKLQGLGLVRFQHQRAVPSCQLYHRYFAQVLKEL